MAARHKGPHERNELVATVETCTLSYSISDHRLSPHRVDDEALLNLSARIEVVGAAHTALLGSTVDIVLASSNSYSGEEPRPASSLPLLSTLSLKRGRCAALVYLPSEVFWGLRPLVADGRLKSIAITYGRPRYGSADLITFAFTESPL